MKKLLCYLGIHNYQKQQSVVRELEFTTIVTDCLICSRCGENKDEDHLKHLIHTSAAGHILLPRNR